MPEVDTMRATHPAVSIQYISAVEGRAQKRCSRNTPVVRRQGGRRAPESGPKPCRSLLLFCLSTRLITPTLQPVPPPRACRRRRFATRCKIYICSSENTGHERHKADLPWYAAAAANMVSLLTRGRLFTAALDSPILCRHTAERTAGDSNG